MKYFIASRREMYDWSLKNVFEAIAGFTWSKNELVMPRKNKLIKISIFVWPIFLSTKLSRFKVI